MFGSGSSGQLGTGRPEKEILPYKLDLYNNIMSISCGQQHTLILTEHLKVYASGNNTLGQLGTGNHKTSYVFQKVLFSSPDTVIKKIAAGQHSAAISEAGDLYIWGAGPFGELLHPHKVTVEKNTIVSEVSVGDGFGCVLDADGNVYSWGYNENGELGIGNYESKKRPSMITSLDGKKVATIACGGKFCMALGMTITQKEQSLQGYRIESSYRNSQKRRTSNLSEDKQMEVNRSAVHPRRERVSETHDEKHHYHHQRPNAGSKHRMSLYIDRPSEFEDERHKSMIQEMYPKEKVYREGKQAQQSRTMLDMWKETQQHHGERNPRKSLERPRERSKENTRRGINVNVEEGTDVMREIKMFKENKERNQMKQYETKEKTPSRKENRSSQKGSQIKENEVRRREEENSMIEQRIIPRGSTGYNSMEKAMSVDEEIRVERRESDLREVKERPKKERREKSRERNRDEELKRENIMLRENMEDLKRRLREYEKKLSGESGKHEKILQRKYENLNRDFNVLENELRMEREAVDELKRSLEEERRHNTKFLKDLEEQRAIALNLEAELRKVYEKENTKKDNLIETEKELEFMRRKNEEFQRRLADTSKEFDMILEEKDAEIKKLENRNSVNIY